MILLDVLLAVFLLFLGAALWQHFRYLKLRRERIDDRQPLFYPARSFHAVTYYLELGLVHHGDIGPAPPAILHPHRQLD